jgi:hypothetical protein
VIRRRALVAGLAVFAAGPARAQDAVSAADRDAIQQVITRQIEAFRRGDDEAAFVFASPDLRTMFGNAATFMRMVRQGYQPVYHPRSFAFGDFDVDDDGPVQELAVIGPDGEPRLAIYHMERQPDGSWRISGCELLDRPQPGS